MFLDLHEGILEEFAAAQRPMTLQCAARVEAWRARRVAARREERRRGAAQRRAVVRRVAERWEDAQRQRRGWKDAAAARLREAREARPVAWSPARPRVEVVTCPRCDGQAERREGVRWLVHRCVAGATKEGAKR